MKCDRRGCCVASPTSMSHLSFLRRAVEESFERPFAAIQERLHVRIRRFGEIVPLANLVLPAVQLAEILLELLQLGVRQVAMFGFARDVRQEQLGFTADLGVLFGPSSLKLPLEAVGPISIELSTLDDASLAVHLLDAIGQAAQAVQGPRLLRQDADAVSQVDGAKFLDLAPHRRALAAGLGG